MHNGSALRHGGYEIDLDRHVYDGENWIYVNLPIEEIEKMAVASIKDGTMMYFSCDVGKFLDREKGFLDIDYFDYGSLMGTTFGMDKKYVPAEVLSILNERPTLLPPWDPMFAEEL